MAGLMLAAGAIRHMPNLSDTYILARAPTVQARVISIIPQTQQFVKRKIKKKNNYFFS